LSSQGFNAVASDNHASNVNAFHLLKEQHHCESSLYIQYSQSNTKTCLFFDNVHLFFTPAAESFLKELMNVRRDINRMLLCPESVEIAYTVAGYVALLNMLGSIEGKF